MISFKKKATTKSLIPEALEYLDSVGVSYKLIDPKKADAESKKNSKSLVLMSFIQNEDGFYQITIKDKDFYTFTRKLIGDKNYLSMRIIDTNEKERTVTAETNHIGKALDVIEVLGTKYNLSIVEEKK